MTIPPGHSTVTGNRVSHSGARALGWLIGIGGVVAGSVVYSVAGPKSAAEGNFTPLWIGLGLGVGGFAVAMPLVLMRDRATIPVESESDLDEDDPFARGLSVNGTF